MLGSASVSKPRPQPSAKLGSSVTWCPEEFTQGAQSGRSSSQLHLLADLFRCTARVHKKCGGNQAEDRRLRLMVNFTLLSVVVLLSLTLMLLVLPVVLPPLPPPPPFLMLVPVVIFILLMLIAFLPSGFNAIVVSYV
jgi:hypothetical protein